MRPLRKILFGQSILLAVLPFVVIAFLGLAWFFPQYKEELEFGQRQVARAIASQTDSYLTASMTRLEDIATLVLTGDHAGRPSQHILKAHVRDTGELNSVYVVNAEGRVTAVALAGKGADQVQDLLGIDLSSNGLWLQARQEKRAVWSDAFLSLVGGGLSVALAIPVGDSVVMGELRLDRLSSYLRNIATTEHELILVLDRRGQVIADREGRYTAQQLNISNLLPWFEGGPAPDGDLVQMDFAGRSMVGILAKAPSVDWYVLAANPSVLAYRPLFTATGIFALALAATLLVGGVVALFLSRRLASKFEALATQARRVASGQEADDWPTSRISEIQTLVGDLRGMAASLRQREESLRREKEFTEALIDALPGAFFLFDDQLRLRRWNRAYLLFSGRGAGEPSGEGGGQGLSLGERDWAVEKVLATLKDGTAAQLESVYVDENGNQTPILFHAVRVETEQGPMIMGVGLDISERKRAEEAVREGEERLRRLVDTANEGVCESDAQRRIVSVNSKMAAMLGYRPQELVGRRLDEFIHPGDLSSFHHSMEMRRLGLGDSYERRYLRKDGSYIWVLVNAAPVVGVNGAYAGSFGMYTDITERKQAEEALQESEKRLRAIFTASADPLVVYDGQGNATYVNPAFTRVFGWSQEEVLGRPIPYVPEDQQKSTQEAIDQLYQSGEAVRVQAKRRTRDGRILDVLVNSAAIRDEEGHGAGLVVQLTDLTPIKHLETQLRQAHKMEAVGALAGGIAHDFNNILAIILGNADLAAEEAPKGSPLGDKLERILSACQRGKDLVGQVLAFARQRERQPVVLEPAVIWGESLKLLKSTLPANISIKQNLPKGRWKVLADPTELHQILLNLCANASHAMREGGGVLAVELEQARVGPGSESAGLLAGEYLRLKVADTGHGMDQATMERIFEPYFSTKPVGEGTGLGLAVVHGLVKAHGGAIHVSSQSGQGATMEVLLPLVQQGAETASPSTQQALPRGAGRILMVDDEVELLAMQRRSMERLGYQVNACENAAQAWRAFKQDPQGFDLVVTDQATPEMTGLQLAAHIRGMSSDVPIILCTGFLERRLEEEIKRVGICEVLVKPFSRSHLAVAVQKALTPRPAAGKSL